MSGPVLVGDVGGTNVRFAVAERTGGRVALSDVWRKPGDGHQTFEDALATYIGALGRAKPRAVRLALAGPRREDGSIRLTNRAWEVSPAALEQRFGFARVSVCNDFAALARAAPELTDEGVTPIKAGEAVAGAPLLVAGPGTGFGVCALLPDGRGWRAMPGEGGHVAYAPATPLEWAFAQALQAEFGYVSVEVALAGVGFGQARRAFAAVHGVPDPDWSPGELVSAAEAGDDFAIAFCRLRAAGVLAAAGDAALTVGAQGGVFLAGGVAERLKAFLREPAALARFSRRGPMSDYLAATPIMLMIDPCAPLIGAAAAHFEAEDNA